MTCYQDGDKSYCRNPGKPTSTTCDSRDFGGFFIRKYNDRNGSGYQDSGEEGLSWKFQWDSNGDGNWHDYDTFADHLGEGGVVYLPVDTQVRIREKSKDGWTATTVTEVMIHIRANDNQLMVFGNWQGKPQVLGITTPVSTPKTGADLWIGALTSLSAAGIGFYLKKRSI